MERNKNARMRQQRKLRCICLKEIRLACWENTISILIKRKRVVL